KGGEDQRRSALVPSERCRAATWALRLGAANLSLSEVNVNILNKTSTQVLYSSAVVVILCVSSAFWQPPARAATPTAPSAAGTIKIGAYAPLSGSYASAGIDMV